MINFPSPGQEKESNAQVMSGGGGGEEMLKLQFDWYIKTDERSITRLRLDELNRFVRLEGRFLAIIINAVHDKKTKKNYQVKMLIIAFTNVT